MNYQNLEERTKFERASGSVSGPVSGPASGPAPGLGLSLGLGSSSCIPSTSTKLLRDPSPQVGNLLLSASNTNVLVSVLSQVFAELVLLLFMGAFDSLRWQLASRRSGVSMATFCQPEL
jgi:hypothetical protein